MKLVLMVEGKQAGSMPLDFKKDNLFKTKLNLAIGLMKIEKGWRMEGKDWEIYVMIKSKML